MKQTAIHFFSIFLAFFLLLSSIGLSLNKMKCLSSGKVKISMLQIKDCGPAEKKPGCDFFLNAKCCEITSSFVHVDIPSLVSYSFIKISNIDTLFTGYLLKFFKTDSFISSTSFLYSDLPPPLKGKDLLNFIQVLRI